MKIAIETHPNIIFLLKIQHKNPHFRHESSTFLGEARNPPLFGAVFFRPGPVEQVEHPNSPNHQASGPDFFTKSSQVTEVALAAMVP